jgi:L-threonylcarbamoyladenylate synthase
MTLVLPRTDLAKDFITGTQDTVAVRVPSHPLANKLLKEFEALGGFGVAAPSANRFGKVSATTARSVKEELEKYLTNNDQILDGGSSQIGIESTIIDCTKDLPVILRPGYITSEMVESFLSLNITEFDLTSNKIMAPGLLDAHYSPNAQVLLNGVPQPGDGFIALANIPTPIGTVRLASPKDNNEYARELYNALRLADNKGIKIVQVIPPMEQGVGVAIKNRLIKAAFIK